MQEDLRRAGQRVAEREQLITALDYLRDGDVLVVTKLDRIARSVRDLVEIVAPHREKGAELASLGCTSTPTTATGQADAPGARRGGRIRTGVMLERQREGIAKAKAEGKYKGRAKTAMAKAGEVETMLAAGVNPTEVARKLGIGRSSVYRAIRLRNIKRQPTTYRPA